LTQLPQHVTRSPIEPANLQAQFCFTLKLQLQILCIWHNFHAENLLISQGTHCHSDMHSDSHAHTAVTKFYN